MYNVSNSLVYLYIQTNVHSTSEEEFSRRKFNTLLHPSFSSHFTPLNLGNCNSQLGVMAFKYKRVRDYMYEGNSRMMIIRDESQTNSLVLQHSSHSLLLLIAFLYLVFIVLRCRYFRIRIIKCP